MSSDFPTWLPALNFNIQINDVPHVSPRIETHSRSKSEHTVSQSPRSLNRVDTFSPRVSLETPREQQEKQHEKQYEKQHEKQHGSVFDFKRTNSEPSVIITPRLTFKNINARLDEFIKGKQMHHKLHKWSSKYQGNLPAIFVKNNGETSVDPYYNTIVVKKFNVPPLRFPSLFPPTPVSGCITASSRGF
jgi:hypothetical protein